MTILAMWTLGMIVGFWTVTMVSTRRQSRDLSVQAHQAIATMFGGDSQEQRIEAAERAFARGDIDVAELERRVDMALRNEGPSPLLAGSQFPIEAAEHIEVLCGDGRVRHIDGGARYRLDRQ